MSRKARLSITQQKEILRYFCLHNGLPARFTAYDMAINRNTINRYYKRFRERICDAADMAPRFGGEVEIDQAFFGKVGKRLTIDRKMRLMREFYGDTPSPKKVKKKKERAKPVMVLGIFNREGKVYTKIIDKADRDTLFPIIHMTIEPKTTVYTDQWMGFSALKIDGYVHKQVNHSRGPVGPDGEHIGNIERFWWFCRDQFKKFRGAKRHTFALHLKEAEFRYNNRHKEFFEVMKPLVFPRQFKR